MYSIYSIVRVLTHYERSGAERSGREYSGAKRRGIHIQADRNGAIYQSLWRTFKCIPAAGRCKKIRENTGSIPLTQREKTMVNFIICSKSSEEMNLNFSLT